MTTGSLDNNLPDVFGGDETNGKYTANVACAQIKCNNWAQDCQLVFDSMDMTPPSLPVPAPAFVHTDAPEPQPQPAPEPASRGDDNARPCVAIRCAVRRVLNGDIDTLTGALSRYRTGAPILRLASVMTERALAVAETALAEAIEKLDALLEELHGSQTNYDTLMNGVWNSTLSECAGSDQEEPCRGRVAEVNARRNDLGAKLSDANAAMLAQQDTVDTARTEVDRLRRRLRTVEVAEQAGLAAFQSAVGATAADEQDAFTKYRAAVVACKPKMDGASNDNEEEQMRDLHDSVQLQLAAVGAATTVAPEALNDGDDPLNPDWEADAIELNITSCDDNPCSIDLDKYLCTIVDTCWHSCPLKIRAAWRALRSAIATAKTSLAALKVGAVAQQILVDAAKVALEEAWMKLVEALTTLRQANADLVAATAAQKITQTTYDQAVTEKGTVEKRCQADLTADPCSNDIQVATLGYNQASTDNADNVKAVLEAQHAVDAARAAVARIRVTIKDLTAALKKALSEQQTRLQGWQDATNAAIETVRRASRTYRRTLRSCSHRANAATADALSIPETWTEEIFKKNADGCAGGITDGAAHDIRRLRR